MFPTVATRNRHIFFLPETVRAKTLQAFKKHSRREKVCEFGGRGGQEPHYSVGSLIHWSPGRAGAPHLSLKEQEAGYLWKPGGGEHGARKWGCPLGKCEL